MPAGGAVMPARVAAAEPFSVKAAPVERAAVKSAAVKPTKSAAVEAAAVKPAKSAAVETPSAAVASAPAPVRCVGETWLAENSRAQQCSCNAHHTPTLARLGTAIA
jgi:hypothetical protein